MITAIRGAAGRLMPSRLGMPPPEPPLADLVHESEHARARAEQARITAGLQPDENGQWRAAPLRGITSGWPPPYGPDPVVFGDRPRVGGDW